MYLENKPHSVLDILNKLFFVFLATGMTFIIGVTNTDADQTSSNGFDFVYAQTPCSLSF